MKRVSFLQHLEPRRDVGSVIVAHVRRDAEIGREKCRSQFRHQLFARIAFVAEALAPEIPRQALLVLGPVHAFMRERGSVALGVAESLERRHLDEIGALGVVGAIAAVADHGAGRGEECVGCFEALCDR